MSSPDDFDPTHALDGWRMPARAPVPADLQLASLLHVGTTGRGAEHRGTVVAEPDAFEPTRALDGWHAPAPAPLDLELRSLQRATTAQPDEAKKAWLKQRGYEMVDVQDIDVPDLPRTRVAEAVAEAVESPAPVAATVDELARMLDEAPPPDVPQEPAPMEAAVEDPALPVAPPVEDLPPPVFAEAEMAPELDFRAPKPPVAPDPDELLAAIELPEVPPPPVAVDTPTLDFRAEPPAAPDVQQVLGDIAFPDVPPPPADIEAPVLDLPAPAAPAARDPRLLAQWRPQAWVAQARRIVDAGVEVQQATLGLRVENRSPQWLCALWSPPPGDAPGLARWPALATVVDADTADAALQHLLPELPPQAELWRADKRDADWALLADLALQKNAGLTPGQTQALRDLADAERHANLLHMTHDYQTEGRLVRRRA